MYCKEFRSEDNLRSWLVSRLFLNLCRFVFTAFVVSGPRLAVADNELCIFVNARGAAVQVNSRDVVPTEFRSSMQCLPSVSIAKGDAKKIADKKGSFNLNNLSDPTSIQLTGNIRKGTFSTSAGAAHIKWPRSVEQLFGRTPERAVTEAGKVISRFFKSPGFPIEAQNINLPWEIVFFDEELPPKDVPLNLISNCHPGWMTPVANVYIVGGRVAAGCNDNVPRTKNKESDAELARVLIHEMGHAVEYQILRDANYSDRQRAEGFATWVEMRASDLTSVIPSGSTRARLQTLAAMGANRPLEAFDGTAIDYARAAMLIDAIASKKGIVGLMKVYNVIKAKRMTFIAAVKEAYGYDSQDLKEAVKVLVNKH